MTINYFSADNKTLLDYKGDYKMNRLDNCTMNSGSDFSGVKVGDRLWLRCDKYEGEAIVTDIYEKMFALVTGEKLRAVIYNTGRMYLDGPQVLFYDKVEIVPPPRPKRMVKKTVMVRPYWISSLKNAMGILVEPSDDPNMRWCGPVQSIEIEVEE